MSDKVTVMFSEMMRHWRYFIPRFTGYGLVLGGLFGGLTYPILGAIVGAPWGLAGGLLLGFLMGIGVPVYNRWFAPDDHEAYQSKLTFGAAAIATTVMAVPLLFIYALVAGLVTAYLTHQYAENPDQLDEKRKHTVDAYQRRDKVFSKVANVMMSRAQYFIGIMIAVASIGYTAFAALDPFTIFRWTDLIFIGIGGVIYGGIVAAMIAAINGLFVVMVNRLFFDPDMSKAQYKARIVPLVGVVTLFLSMIVTLGVGAPFAAIVGAMGASKYADWYYEHDSDTKVKRDTRHLEDNLPEDDDYLRRRPSRRTTKTDANVMSSAQAIVSSLDFM